MSELIKWPDLLHDWLKEYWPHGKFELYDGKYNGYPYVIGFVRCNKLNSRSHNCCSRDERAIARVSNDQVTIINPDIPDHLYGENHKNDCDLLCLKRLGHYCTEISINYYDPEFVKLVELLEITHSRWKLRLKSVK